VTIFVVKGKDMTLEIGAKAPEFTLPMDGNGTISLKDFANKNLVIYFYPKDDTPGCTKEAIEFNSLRAAFLEVNAEILGVSADAVSSHDKFKAKYGLCFALASDENKEMLGAYGVWGEKRFMGKKYMGIERTTFLVDGKGIITHIWHKVKADGHAQQVLDAVLKQHS
jgi:thioredoxin-dependent peroxiredoxin